MVTRLTVVAPDQQHFAKREFFVLPGERRVILSYAYDATEGLGTTRNHDLESGWWLEIRKQRIVVGGRFPAAGEMDYFIELRRDGRIGVHAELVTSDGLTASVKSLPEVSLQAVQSQETDSESLADAVRLELDHVALAEKRKMTLPESTEAALRFMTQLKMLQAGHIWAYHDLFVELLAASGTHRSDESAGADDVEWERLGEGVLAYAPSKDEMNGPKFEKMRQVLDAFPEKYQSDPLVGLLEED